jgi:hypothetical protein
MRTTKMSLSMRREDEGNYERAGDGGPSEDAGAGNKKGGQGRCQLRGVIKGVIRLDRGRELFVPSPNLYFISATKRTTNSSFPIQPRTTLD